MRYLEGLNERQKEAVLATAGPVSVLAGAGSGKTRVLTTRIYHLLRQGVPPERILAVTFTNKAAREMRERVHAMLGSIEIGSRENSLAEAANRRGEPRTFSQGTGFEAPRAAPEAAPTVATFHGLGRILLETYGRSIGVPRFFTIFDRDDSERAVKEALKIMGIDPKEVPPRGILSRISKAKGDGMTLDEFRTKHGRDSFRLRVVADAWNHYDSVLTKEKALDFDDLIMLPVRMLEEHADVRAAAEARWEYLHIDEYQDTNALQGRLVNALSGARKNVFVVGDIDQTIYTWRGATIDNLLAFDETYPDAKTIVLEQNYRSTKTIVAAGNQIIEKNLNRKEKFSVTDNADGEAIRIHIARTAEEEAAWIAHEARATVSRGARPEDIAVLFRTNAQSRALEEAFLRAGLPYRLLGTRYFERKEVKDMLSWIRLAMEPTREADKIRAAQTPPRGLGKLTLAKVAAGKTETLRPSERAKLQAFADLIDSLSSAAENLTPSAFVELIVEKSGMKAHLTKGGEEDLERLENIRELGAFAARYDAVQGKEGIAAFLADAALASDQDEMDRKKDARGVTLMTVHAAKGLEFDTVFVSGMEEGLFPHEGMGDEDRDEEEERRLFYVAVTRAKRRLFLTLARVRRIYGTEYLSEPSPFIRDIDESLVSVDDDDDGLPSIFI